MLANTVSSFLTSLTHMQLLPFLFSLRLQPTATSMSLSKVCESIEQCPHGCLCLGPSFFHSLTGLLRYFPPPNPFSSPSRCRVTSQTRSRGGSSQRCALTSDLRMTLFLFFRTQTLWVKNFDSNFKMFSRSSDPEISEMYSLWQGFHWLKDQMDHTTWWEGGCGLNPAALWVCSVYWLSRC